MAEPITTAPPAAPSRATTPTTIQSLLALLMEQAGPDLSADELQHVAHASECAQAMAERAAALAEGLGCMLMAEAGQASRAGSFETPDRVAGLLFLLGDTFNAVAGLVEVAERARARVAIGETGAGHG